MDGLAEILNRLIDVVEGVSPHVWEIAVRQATVSGIQTVLAAILLIAIGVFLIWCGRRAWEAYEKEGEYSPYDLATLFAYVFGAAAFAAGCALFIDSIRFFANPEYQAMKDLILQLK